MRDTPGKLAMLLRAIEANDEKYGPRYGLVLDALAVAHRLGFQAGFRIDPAEPDWPVAYIELPTGQVSWHLPQHPTAYDGHSTAAKYKRINEWIAEAVPV